MINSVLSASISSLIMSIAFSFNKGLHKELNTEKNKNWKLILLLSFIFGTILGSISGIITELQNDTSDILFLAIFGSVIGYLFIQTSYTDFLLHKGDKYSLRMGYLITVILSIIYIFINYSSIVQYTSFMMLGLILLAIFGLFLFSPLGASDIRALAIMLPLLITINTKIGLYCFGIAMIFSMITLFVWQKIVHAKVAVPVLPFFLFLYVIATPCFSIFMNIMLASSLR